MYVNNINMGFDLTVALNVGIDPKTGMAFVYAFNTNVGVNLLCLPNTQFPRNIVLI